MRVQIRNSRIRIANNIGVVYFYGNRAVNKEITVL